MAINEAATLSRRTFVKGSLAGLALAGAAGQRAVRLRPQERGRRQGRGRRGRNRRDRMEPVQRELRRHAACSSGMSKDGKIAYMETDNTGEAEGLQARACLRGRSMRRWVNQPGPPARSP